jgi:hypothetical protein
MNENLFIYGVNSMNQCLKVNIVWKPVNEKINARISLRFEDNDANIYTLEEETSVKYTQNEYKLCGFGFEIMFPFRRNRLKFRGYLRKNGEQLVYTRIRLLWLAISRVYDFNNDFDDGFLAKELAKQSNVKDIYTENRFEQFGQMKGTFQIEKSEPKIIYLWGSKCKSYLTSIDNQKFVRIFGYSKTGNYS